MSNLSSGCRYEETKDLELSEVAKVIKRKITQRMSNDAMPQAEVSVTTDKNSRGLDVRIKSWPDDEKLFKFLNPDDDKWGRNKRLSMVAQKTISSIEKLVKYYNCVRQDTGMRRFYSSVNFERKFRANRCAAEKQQWEASIDTDRRIWRSGGGTKYAEVSPLEPADRLGEVLCRVEDVDEFPEEMIGKEVKIHHKQLEKV